MAGLSMQGIKRRIRSVTSIEHITSAMKLVSAAKLRRARNIYERVEANLHFITDSINEIIESVPEAPADYLAGSREIKRTCYVVVTSNRGLAGSFNANVIKEAERLMASAEEKPLLVCIGSKGRDYFQKKDYEILCEYLDPPESATFEEMSGITKEIVSLYDEHAIDELVFVYTEYVSTMEQHVVSKRFLPFEKASDKSEKEDVAQDTASDEESEEAAGSAQASRERKMEHPVDYEPGPEAVFSYLIPKAVEIMFYRTVVESAICEHAARRMAMQNATDNAREMMTDLNLFYNRARQASITSEITEIISGAEQVS